MIIDFMGQEEYVNNRGVNAEGLENVVNLTLSEPNYGFFLLGLDTNTKIQSLIMISYEFTDWRNGVFYWIQFAEATSEDALKEILAKIKDMSKEDEWCKGIRAVYDNKYSDHWKKIDENLDLAKSHYYVYHIDTKN